jgi:hypothetical protein
LDKACLQTPGASGGGSGQKPSVSSFSFGDREDNVVWNTLESSTGSFEGLSFQQAYHNEWNALEGSTTAILEISSSEDHTAKYQQRLMECILITARDERRRSLEPSSNAAKQKKMKRTFEAASQIASRRHIVNLDEPLDDDEKRVEQALHQVGVLEAKRALLKQGVDIERLIELVPRKENGFPSSIGSIGHYSHRCKEACAFVQGPKSCANGIYCNFCHCHGGMQKRKKSKRDRYCKFKELLNLTEAGPNDFQFDHQVKRKLVAL